MHDWNFQVIILDLSPSLKCHFGFQCLLINVMLFITRVLASIFVRFMPLKINMQSISLVCTTLDMLYFVSVNERDCVMITIKNWPKCEVCSQVSSGLHQLWAGLQSASRLYFRIFWEMLLTSVVSNLVFYTQSTITVISGWILTFVICAIHASNHILDFLTSMFSEQSHVLKLSYSL